MAPREELSRIGREGFAAIDKVYGHSSSQWPRHRQEVGDQQQVKLCYSVYRRTELVSRVYQQTPTYIVHQAQDVYNGNGYGWGNRVASKEGGVMDSKTAARRFGGIIQDVKYYGWPF